MSLITWSSLHREENSSSLWWSFSVRSTIWLEDVRKCWPETLEINEDFAFTYTGWVCPFPMHLSLPIHMLGNILHFWFLIKKIKKIKKEALLTIDLFLQSFILFLWPHKFWFLQQKCCQNKLIYVFLFIHRKKLASIYLTSCQRSIFHSFHFWCSRTLFTQKAKLHKDDFCLKNYLGKFMHKSNHTVFKTYYTILSIW